METDLTQFLRQQLAQAEARSAVAEERAARLERMLERQNLLLERLNGQLESVLRRLARYEKPKPPDDPQPPPAAPGPAESPETPEPAVPSLPKKERKKRARRGRSQLSASIPRDRDIHRHTACVNCSGSRLTVIGQEKSETVRCNPASLSIVETTRETTRCLDCGHISTAEVPPHLLPRWRATPSMVAHVINEKFGRHLSLNHGNEDNGNAGFSLAGQGDADGDGWCDLLIGAWLESGANGTVYLYLGDGV